MGVMDETPPNEDRLIVYLKERQEQHNYAPSTVKHTMKYSKLDMYMKKTTKADVFTTEQWVKFMDEADDKDHLLHKVCTFLFLFYI